MQVQNISVEFLREKQPKDYEKVVPKVTFHAALEDGEDHNVVARTLMRDAAGVVYAGIGVNTPKPILDKLGLGVPTVNVSQKATNNETEKASDTKVAKPKEEKRAISETPEDRKNPEDDVPGSESEPETESIPGGEGDVDTVSEDKNEVPTAEILHAYILECVQGKNLKKKVPTEKVMEIFGKFKVERVSDMNDEQRSEAYEIIKELATEANKG